VVSNFTDPTISSPSGIAAGPDGALWFTNGGDCPTEGAIGRITTTGALSSYNKGSKYGCAIAITTGPDGALWFTQDDGVVGRITTTGTDFIYTKSSNTGLSGITGGPDGAVWYTNTGTYNGYTSVDRLETQPYVSVDPTSGGPGIAVSVSGGGYYPGKEVKVGYDTGLRTPKERRLCVATVSASGQFVCSGNLPLGMKAGASGVHSIVATSPKSKAETTFSLT